MNSYSPIVIFTYNRPLHTEQVLDALAQNKEAKDSILYIFCDGSKENATSEDLLKIEATRNLVNAENRFKEVIINIQKKNKGLANSIIDGVTDVINQYGKVIVLEDDIVPSIGFLKYMNDALLFYENSLQVMHISGFMFPHQGQLPETFFFNVPLCWGWATWSRAWTHFENNSLKLWNELRRSNALQELDKFGGDYLSCQLAHNITGKLNTWFIKWHASVLLQKGFTLYPKHSLVQNIGFDNTGVHNRETPLFKHLFLQDYIYVDKIAIEENIEAGLKIKEFYLKLNRSFKVKKVSKFNLKKKIKNKIRFIFFNLFPEFKRVIQINNDFIQCNSYLGNYCKIYPKGRLSNSIVGSYSYIAENSIINNTIIGKFCSIGPNLISGWGIHPTNGISTHPMFYSTKKQNGLTLSSIDKIEETKPIVIGNDVFIGMNVTILDGVNIGDGAVIGAGAVVSKDIPPYAIAVGNPIEIIKYRFNNEIIEKLNQIKWWDGDIKELNLVEERFFDVDKFVNILKKSE